MPDAHADLHSLVAEIPVETHEDIRKPRIGDEI